MTAVEKLKALGGRVEYVYPPIPIRTEDYQAFHPGFTDPENGGEVSIGHGVTAEVAAWDALLAIYENLDEFFNP